MNLRKTITFLSITLSLLMLLVVTVFAEETTDEEPGYFPEFVLGDVDCNKLVNAADARLTLRVAAGLTKIIEIDYIAADYNKDSVISASDARCILRFSAGLDPFGKTEPEKSKLIKITPVCQYPDFPSGCEMVAAIMNLNYLGFDITNEEFVESFLPIGLAPYEEDEIWYSSDPNESFLGDPASDKGWGIWAKGLNTAIQRYLDTQEKYATVSYTYSETLDSLCEKYVEKDIPVLVWVTVNMQEPYERLKPFIIGTEQTFTWMSPNHCMLLVGYDSTGYYFNDPTTGKLEKYGKDVSNQAFIGNGSQAVVIVAEN